MSLMSVPVTHNKLSQEQMDRLRQKLGGFAIPIVNKDTDAHEAGFKLGIQYVLHVLSVEGFAV